MHALFIYDVLRFRTAVPYVCLLGNKVPCSGLTVTVRYCPLSHSIGKNKLGIQLISEYATRACFQSWISVWDYRRTEANTPTGCKRCHHHRFCHRDLPASLLLINMQQSSIRLAHQQIDHSNSYVYMLAYLVSALSRCCGWCHHTQMH